MKFYGNVAGVQHSAQQQVAERPISGSKCCKNCHQRFNPKESGMYAYCSPDCRDARRRMLRNTKWKVAR